MAAIDNIYLHSYDEFVQFRNWCGEQPLLKDKYGKNVAISSYLIKWFDNPECWVKETCHPVMSAPGYVDAYIIRNCPIKSVQEELMFKYGFTPTEIIREMYEVVNNRTEDEQKLIDKAKSEGVYPVYTEGDGNVIQYWYLNSDDFQLNPDGTIVFVNREKSDYEKILDGELYSSPSVQKYQRGTHFRLIKHAYDDRRRYNRPMVLRRKSGKMRPKWMVSVKLPEYAEHEYMVWHANTRSKPCVGTWDFTSEFVVSLDGWSSSSAFCKTIKSLRRRIKRWKLPVGSVVIASGRYIDEDYEFIVTK